MASSGRFSLPFARRYMLQTLQTLYESLGMPHPAANRHPNATSMASYGHPSLPFARLQTLQTLKTLQIPRDSCHQASLSASAVPALACSLPAHSPLLLGHSSLPFARLPTLKTLKTLRTLKTLQIPRGSFPRPLAVSFCCSKVAACQASNA